MLKRAAAVYVVSMAAGLSMQHAYAGVIRENS